MIKVKICGITSEYAVDAVNDYAPDYAGFVFAPSRRQVTIQRAAVLCARLRPEIVPVGVFVNAPIKDIQAVAPYMRLVQLHGDEDDAYVAAVQKLGLAVIKTVRMRAGMPTGAVCGAEYALLEPFVPYARGGTGIPLDWKAAAALQTGVPTFFAGGLNVDNVSAALVYRPFAVDVSSGVETDGKKDARKIREFIRRVRQYE